MKMWEVYYTTDTVDRKREIVAADTFTMAYVEFTVQFSSEYYILDIKDVTEVI